MDKLLTLEKPSVGQQLDFVRHLRQNPKIVIKAWEASHMLKAIEDTLTEIIHPSTLLSGKEVSNG